MLFQFSIVELSGLKHTPVKNKARGWCRRGVMGLTEYIRGGGAGVGRGGRRLAEVRRERGVWVAASGGDGSAEVIAGSGSEENSCKEARSVREGGVRAVGLDCGLG